MRNRLDISKDLNANLLKENVKERPGPGGKKLSYLETWHCIDEANRIFGWEGWKSETLRETQHRGPDDKYGNPTWECVCTVRVHAQASDGEPTFHDGTGFGNGNLELAVKEAESDAKKRAFMNFGNPFGLPLYNPGDERVADVQTLPKKDARVVYSALEAALRMSQNLEELAECWKANAEAIQSLPADWRRNATAEKDRLKEQLS